MMLAIFEIKHHDVEIKTLKSIDFVEFIKDEYDNEIKFKN